MKKLILIFFVIINTFIFSEEYISGKITAKLGSVKENNLVTDMELTEETEDIVVYEIKTGKDIVNVESPVYSDKSLNINFKAGDRVILMKDEYEDGRTTYFITDTDKRISYAALSLIFIIFTVAMAKIKGVKALFALGVSVAAIFYFFLPLF